MLAEGDFFNVAIVLLFVLIAIGKHIAESVRKKKAEEAARELRSRRSPTQSEPEASAKAAPESRPAAGGLAALLEALEAKASGGELRSAPPPPPPSPPPVPLAPPPLPPSREFTQVDEGPPTPAEPEQPEPEAAPAAEPSRTAAPKKLAAVGLFAGPGPAPLRDQARRGVLWSVVLGPPRGTVPYGECGAAEAPGGVV